ncbi:uncharacterized protein [Asterias amurensis]|uniref:uncharacterized protein n=1 Tax=Asterias amurensis TaxID=7602 RepID=UPI003AB47A94
MGCMYSKNNLPKVIGDSDTGPMRNPKYSKKTLKSQNAVKAKMNKALAEVKARGDAKLAAFAELAGIQLPAATIQQSVNEQAPLPEQATPMETLKASMKSAKVLKISKVSSTGIDDKEAIPVSISTDVIAKTTINDTLSKTEELKEQTESAPAFERPTNSAQSTSSRLIVVTEATVDNTLWENLPTTSVPCIVEIMPATERPSSSASACSRLIVVAEAKTSIDNTMDETIPLHLPPPLPRLRRRPWFKSHQGHCVVRVFSPYLTAWGFPLETLGPLNQLASSVSSLDKATTNLVDAVFTSLDNEETAQESIVDVQNSDAVINGCNMPLNQLASSVSSLDKATSNLVDAVFTSLDNEETTHESIVDVQNSDAVVNGCNMPLNQLASSVSSLDKATTNLVDAVFTSLDNEETTHESIVDVQNSDAVNNGCNMPLNQLASSVSSLDKATSNLVDAVFTSLDNEETTHESIVDVQNSDAVINDCNMPLNQLASSVSSLDKATTNLVDAVFTSLDNEETAQESIVDVQNSDAVINGCNMPATKTSTGSLDQEAGFIVDSVLANITTLQLSMAPEKPKVKSSGSIATDTENDKPATKISIESLDQEAGFIVDSVLADITTEQLFVAADDEPKMKSTGSIATDTKDDKPATKISIGSLDQEAGFIVDSVLANITSEQLSVAADEPKMKSTGSTAMDTEDDKAISNRSAVDKEEITRVIIAQLKKSLSNSRHSTSQMATQTCEISIQTDDVIETDKPSRKSSALSKIKAVVVKSASKTSRMSFLGRKDKKPNESIKKDLKNNKQALMSQRKTKSVSAKKPGPKNAKVVETKKSVNAKSDVTKKPTGDHKKSSTVTNAKKSSSTSTTKRSSSTDHKKSSTKPRGSAASGRMIREAANGAKVSTKKPSKKVSTISSSSSATTDAKTKENPAKKLNTSKSTSFTCNGTQQKPTASSASAAKTQESSQSASDKPTSKRSKQRTATPVPSPLYDKSSSWKSKSSSGLKQNQSSFLAPQDVASSPSVHAGGKISSVESKDSNIALLPANSQDSFKPNTKRSGRNGSKRRVSITSDNTLRRISSACPAPGPKRAGLASVPELRPISVMDTPTDAGLIQNPRCPLDQAMGDNTEVQLESQSSVGLNQGDVTLGISDTENQVKICRLEQIQEMDDHSMELQLQELLLSQEILVSPSLMPKEEATLQVTNPLSDKDQLCETPEVVSSKGMFSPRSLMMTADDSDNSTDSVNQSLEVSKSPSRRQRASVESPPGKDTTILNPKPPDSKRVSRDFKMNRVTQWTQDSSGLGRISVSPHTRRSFDSPGYKTSPNISPTLLALNKSPNDFPNERDMGQVGAPKSPGGSTSKLAHYVRASESPQGKMTINFSPTQPASRKALSDFLNGPVGQPNTHDNPSKKTVVDIPMMPNLGLSMKVSKTGPGGTRSPEGRTSVSPTNYKKTPSKTSLFAPANNNRPLSGTLDITNCLFQELTTPNVDKEERTSLSPPIYHSPASTADWETHRQQESTKLQLGCIRLQH